MIALITSLIKSLELYLNLKNKKFYLEMFEHQREHEKALMLQIDLLRNNRSIQSTDEADLLQRQLMAGRADWDRLQKLYNDSK